MRLKTPPHKKRACRLILLLSLVLGGLYLLLHNVSHVRNIMPDALADFLRENQMRDVEPDAEKLQAPINTEPPTRTQLLKVLLNCKDRPLTRETRQYGEYWLLRNFMRGSVSTNIGCAESITYTTNGDYTFFDSLPTVVSRWLAPISFAIYAPGYDVNATVDCIQYVRNCLPESELIREYVTFHMFFPAKHMPDYVPLTEDEILDWDYNCDVEMPPYEHVDRSAMYKTAMNLTYPINVGRNIARKSSNTYFIFASDIELFPSRGLVDQFLDMVSRNQSVIFGGKAPRVFPMPVFEVHENATIPESKNELLKMLKNKTAIPFHSRLCKNCHLVPNQTEWLNATESSELSVFSVGKREGSHTVWEPFYISDNKEPLFDERVTWEGQSNKRIQGYAMCLVGYEYHVLYPAFLVHTPGIKVFEKNSPRLKFVGPMNRLISKKIKPEYKILYGTNEKCRV